MTKKQQKNFWLGVALVGGAGIVVTAIVLSSGGNKNQFGLQTASNDKAPPTNNTGNSGGYNGGGAVQQPYVNPNGYSTADTIAVQTYLYKHYPTTISKIGDIGTNGKPDGIWGNNTTKVVNSVISSYYWNSVAELIEYAKNKQVPFLKEA